MNNIKLKILLSFVLTFSTIFINTFSQPNSSAILDLKIKLKFDNWEGGNNNLRNGINISREKINALRNIPEIMPKKLFFLSQQDNGKSFVKYCSKWKINENDFVEVTLSFLNSGIDAQEYLISQFVSSTLPIELKYNSKDTPSIVGDISFFNGTVFIRDNILVQIHAEGEIRRRLINIAKEIDSLLLKQPVVQSWDNYKPRIITTNTNKKEIILP